MAAQIPIVATSSAPGIARNSKKRPASPANNGISAGGYSTSKKKKTTASNYPQGISMEAISENKMVPSDFSTGPVERAAKPLPFKDPNFVTSVLMLLRPLNQLRSILMFQVFFQFPTLAPSKQKPEFYHCRFILHVLYLHMNGIIWPTTRTPRASCASAPSKSFPTSGGCRPMLSPATWP
ncbi:INO80 complex subunit C isoform 2-T2 [Trichechus inunguis]